MFDFFEFFAGGGMVRAGLGSAKWRCRFANDFDHKKSAVYRRNWGDGILKTADVRTLVTQHIPGDADLAWASFPCQDLSLAGGGAGLEGDRSMLSDEGQGENPSKQPLLLPGGRRHRQFRRHVWSRRSPREIEAVEALLRRALEVSPGYPRAHSLLAWARATAVHQGWADMREGLAEAGALASYPTRPARSLVTFCGRLCPHDVARL